MRAALGGVLAPLMLGAAATFATAGSPSGYPLIALALALLAGLIWVVLFLSWLVRRDRAAPAPQQDGQVVAQRGGAVAISSPTVAPVFNIYTQAPPPTSATESPIQQQEKLPSLTDCLYLEPEATAGIMACVPKVLATLAEVGQATKRRTAQMALVNATKGGFRKAPRERFRDVWKGVADDLLVASERLQPDVDALERHALTLRNCHKSYERFYRSRPKQALSLAERRGRYESQLAVVRENIRLIEGYRQSVDHSCRGFDDDADVAVDRYEAVLDRFRNSQKAIAELSSSMLQLIDESGIRSQQLD